MKILVTGCAGFIGMHTAEKFLAQGDEVIGIDNLNHYYDPSLKAARLALLSAQKNFRFKHVDIADRESMALFFQEEQPQRVVHLAAQAGVRYSLENPHAYIESNIQGFMNILEGCRQYMVEHLVYASSSTVYGSNTTYPFVETQPVDHPMSLYAATKRANELMAHTYSHLYQLPTTGLRFFTVYGPWGRPDMALFKFTKAILAGDAIDLYNHGDMVRDFTYIDDIVEGVMLVTNKCATPDPNFDTHHPNSMSSCVPYRVFNIGNDHPVVLLDYIHALEEALGLEAKKNYLPMQPGDVSTTASNTDALYQWVGFKPNTMIPVGVGKFVAWYRDYYGDL